MSLSASEMTPADIAACCGGNNDGFGDGNGWWIILFFILCMNGGWNNGFNNGGGVPFVASDVQRGFDQSAVMSGINGLSNAVTSGFGDVQTALCGGFAGVNASIANGFAQAEIADNARQIANMNQMFGVQSALQNCCCENRANIADLKYTVATENCADRQALSDGVRDIIASNTASTQAILDKLCQQEIEAKNDTIATLRQELLYARGQASQDVQTAALRAGQVAEVDALYSRLKDCPVPTMPVYGQTPIFTCNNGCGCNGGM